MTRLRKLKLYALSAILFGLTFAVAFGVAEVILRFLTLRGVVESRDHVIMTPSQPATFKPNYSGRIWDVPFSTNNFGFRGEPQMSLKPGPGEVRILSLGDSIGFGLGIPARDHYTKVAERRLATRFPQRTAHVVNAGGQGYSPSGYGVFLRETGAALQPSLVVLEIELCNDVTDEALLGRRYPENGPRMPLAVTGGRYVVGWDGNLLATLSVGPFLIERTYLYTDLWRRWLNLRHGFDPNPLFRDGSEVTYYTLGFDRIKLDSQRIESGWAEMFETLQGIHQFLDRRRIPFLLLIMPSRYIYQPQAPAKRDFAQALVDRAVLMSKERSIPSLDMTGTIGRGGGADLYFDFAHLTVEGNRVVGERLAAEIASVVFSLPANPAEAAGPP